MLITSSKVIRDFSKSFLDLTSIIKVVFSPFFLVDIIKFNSVHDIDSPTSLLEGTLTPKLK